MAATLVTKVPSGGNANALGITKGGTAMYAVNQTTSKANSAVIHGYSTSTQTWTTYTGNSSGAKDSFVAGAVNPATGIYYYVTYSAGSASRPGTGTVYGFNTNTTTRITGVIATFSLPTGNGTAGNNGDIAFDSAGNMYVLASNGSEVGIGVVKGPIPTTGSSSGAPLTDTLLNRFADRNSYNGIAFDNSGNLYVSGIPGGTSVLTKLNPNTGAVIAGPTKLSSNAQNFANVDLAACSLNPTLSLRKDIVARYAPGDQFTLTITGGGSRDGNTATTTGDMTGVQREVAGPIIARSDTTYTLHETAASGSLLNYTTTYSCVDTANGNAHVASGAGRVDHPAFPRHDRGLAERCLHVHQHAAQARDHAPEVGRREDADRRRDAALQLPGHKHRQRNAGPGDHQRHRVHRARHPAGRDLPGRGGITGARGLGHLHSDVHRYPGRRGRRICQQHGHRVGQDPGQPGGAAAPSSTSITAIWARPSPWSSRRPHLLLRRRADHPLQLRRNQPRERDADLGQKGPRLRPAGPVGHQLPAPHAGGGGVPRPAPRPTSPPRRMWTPGRSPTRPPRTATRHRGLPVVSAPSSATITAIQAPAITVVKSASPSMFLVAGGTYQLHL